MEGYNIVIHIMANESEKANAMFYNSHGIEGFNKLRNIIEADNYLNTDMVTINDLDGLTVEQEHLLKKTDKEIVKDKYLTQRALLLLEIVGAKIMDIEQYKKWSCNQTFLFEPQKGKSNVYSNYINTKMQEASKLADGDIWYDMKTKKIRINCFEYLSPYEYEEKKCDEYFADLYVYDGASDITAFSVTEIEAIEQLFDNFPLSTKDGIVITLI
jgi:hypothetical protein